MITEARLDYNKRFSRDKYQQLLTAINDDYGKEVTFRIAETPVFIPDTLAEQLHEACSLISAFLITEEFKHVSSKAVGKIGLNVPNENAHATFLQYDFGIIRNDDGTFSPRLIEMQGFPSLYAFQTIVERNFRTIMELDSHFTPYFQGYNDQTYVDHLRDIIPGQEDPIHTILLEIDPEKQNTAIDFYETEKLLGIKVLDLKDLKKEGRDLYYLENGKKIHVNRIYNRVIFDELDKRTDLKPEFDFRDEVNVEWVGHPNWFSKISKHTIPFLPENPYVPQTRFLDRLEKIPDDLENYVLKPLFSFSGEGVKFHVDRADIEAVKDPENWILQEKIQYYPAIQSPDPDQPIKCEIRMMHTWAPQDLLPKVVNNLVRLSKGEMIGVKYNKDKEWVGASFGLFTL